MKEKKKKKKYFYIHPRNWREKFKRVKVVCYSHGRSKIKVL